MKPNNLPDAKLTKMKMLKEVFKEPTEAQLIDMFSYARVNADEPCIPEEFKCMICKNLLFRPMQCSKCQAAFCVHCLQDKKKENNGSAACPDSTCRSLKTEFKVCEFNRFLFKYLRDTKIICTKKECTKKNVEYTYTDFIKLHPKFCFFREALCPLQCGQMLSMNDNKHAEECPHGAVTCPECKKLIIYYDGLPYHERKAPSVKIDSGKLEVFVQDLIHLGVEPKNSSQLSINRWKELGPLKVPQDELSAFFMNNFIQIVDNEERNQSKCVKFEETPMRITRFMAEGDIQEGFFKGDELNGFGRIIYDNGDYFEGYFHNDMREGRGKLVQTEDKIMEGVWEEDDVVSTEPSGRSCSISENS